MERKVHTVKGQVISGKERNPCLPAGATNAKTKKMWKGVRKPMKRIQTPRTAFPESYRILGDNSDSIIPDAVE